MRNAIQRLALLPIVALFLLPAACHRTDGRAEALLNNADSLLTANPDSALRLLEALPATTELTRRESARYALLLAQATDKCEKPLLPCDSLLDVALDYYDDDERERAVALLYKGRLEVEMEQSERAIGFLLEGLEIIKKFPKRLKPENIYSAHWETNTLMHGCTRKQERRIKNFTNVAPRIKTSR